MGLKIPENTIVQPNNGKDKQTMPKPTAPKVVQAKYQNPKHGSALPPPSIPKPRKGGTEKDGNKLLLQTMSPIKLVTSAMVAMGAMVEQSSKELYLL